MKWTYLHVALLVFQLGVLVFQLHYTRKILRINREMQTENSLLMMMHPHLGRTVPFKQGMTLMPGESATIIVPLTREGDGEN